jgi:CRP/FNR family transcriptional regulator, cyclic AMP receptor protein
MVDEKLELLSRVPLFAGLNAEQLEAIAKISEERDVKAGSALTHEGRHEGYFFVIISGIVGIERGGGRVNTIGPGDFLGEIALIDGGPRTATAVAQTDARLLVMTYPRFQELLDASPHVRTAVMEEMGRRLRKLDEDSVY